MPSDNNKNKNNNDDDDSSRDVLQAVLLADSFTDSFRPVTLCPDTPRVLCPLNNLALLDHSLEWLAGSGVEELFLFCASGHDAVRRHVAAACDDRGRYRRVMDVRVLRDGNCRSAGDALREIDRRGLVRSDPFLLLHGGDLVTNVDAAPLLERHRRRRARDPAATLTIALAEVGRTSATRSTTSDLVVGLAGRRDSRVLCYHDRPRRPSVPVPCSFLAEADSTVSLRDDLLDCGLDVCSPDVLARFSDEFDYRHVRKQFVANAAAEEEVGLQNRVYAEILPPTEYAVRVTDFRTYHRVSRDVLRRWCHPTVPDNRLETKKHRYVADRGHRYRDIRGKDEVDRTSVVGPCTMTGANVKIGAECVVEHTVIGHDCVLHPRVTLTSSHLWNKVVVHAGAKVTHAILCDDVVVREGAVVGKGCVIGRGCVVGTGVVLPDNTRLTLEKDRDDDDFGDDDGFEESSDEEEDSDESSDDDEDDDDDEKNETRPTSGDQNVVTDHDVVGEDGKGRVWRVPNITRDDDNPDVDSDYDTGSDDDDDDDDDSQESPDVVWDVRTPKQRAMSKSMGYDVGALYKARFEAQKREGRRDEEDAYRSDDDDVAGDLRDDGVVLGAGATSFDHDPASLLPSSSSISASVVGRSRGVDVVKELREICLEHDDGSSIENLMIELNSFKFSQNATFSDCVAAAARAALERLSLSPDTTTSRSLKAGLTERLRDHDWGALLRKLCHTRAEERALVAALEDAAVVDDDAGAVLRTSPNFRVVLQTLYDDDVVTEEAVLEWAKDRRESLEGRDDDDARKKLFYQPPTQTFLEWLEDEDSDDDDDDSDDSDSDDE